MNLTRKIIILFLFTKVLLPMENAKQYIGQVNSGSIEEPMLAIDSLMVNYPNDVSVIYLEALLSKDGEKAFNNYKKIFELYPDSEYADEALMRIGEYYYAKGLYSQSAAWLKKIPLYYSRSDMVEKSVHLFLNSLKVMGYNDTAIFYTKVFKKQFPNILFNEDVEDQNNNVNIKALSIENKKSEIILSNKTYRYALQIGAFSYLKNANKEKKLLEAIGYNVIIEQIEKNKRVLHVVRVGYYGTKKEAESIKRALKKDIGKESFVVEKK